MSNAIVWEIRMDVHRIPDFLGLYTPAALITYMYHVRSTKCPSALRKVRPQHWHPKPVPPAIPFSRPTRMRSNPAKTLKAGLKLLHLDELFLLAPLHLGTTTAS